MEIKKQVIYKDGRYIQISGGGGGAANIVETDELPETGVENTLYLIPGTGGGEGGAGGWEKVSLHLDSNNTEIFEDTPELHQIIIANSRALRDKLNKCLIVAIRYRRNGNQLCSAISYEVFPDSDIVSASFIESSIQFFSAIFSIDNICLNFDSSYDTTVRDMLEEGFDIDFYFNYGEGGGTGGGGTGAGLPPYTAENNGFVLGVYNNELTWLNSTEGTIHIASHTEKGYGEPVTATLNIRCSQAYINAFKEELVNSVESMAGMENLDYDTAVNLLYMAWPTLDAESRMGLLGMLSFTMYNGTPSWYVYDPDNEFGGANSVSGNTFSITGERIIYGVNLLPDGNEFVNLSYGFSLGEELTININPVGD